MRNVEKGRHRVNTIAEIEEIVEDDLRTTNSKVYFINAFLSFIKSDENTVYPSCLQCNKKVIKETSIYRCENCGITVDKPVFKFNLTTKLEDATGSIYARFLGNQAL